MNSRPISLLPFDIAGAEQLHWSGATDEVIFCAPATQSFVCRQDRLYRIEIYLEPRYRPVHCHLWLKLCTDGEVIRLVGPLASDSLLGHGWFSFEFEPVGKSSGKVFSFVLDSPDGLPGNAFRVRSLSGPANSLTFRAICVRAPELFNNFCRFRRDGSSSATVRYAPLMAFLETSRLCNLGCIMCYRGINGFDPVSESPPFMTFDAFRTIEPVLATLLCVTGFGLGEPFLNPDFLAILRHIKKRNPFAWVFASTNGTRIDDDVIRSIVAEELFSHLQVSIDGADRETYESVRRHASYAVVRRTLDRLLMERERPGCRRLTVKTEMLVMKPTSRQIGMFVRQMAAAGVDQIVLDTPRGAPFRELRIETDAEMEAVYDQILEAHHFLEGSNTVLEGPLLVELRQWHAASGRPGPPLEFGVDPCTWMKAPMNTARKRCNSPWQSLSLRTDGSIRRCGCSIRRFESGSLGVEPNWLGGAGYAEIRSELLGHQPLNDECARCQEENVAEQGQIITPIYEKACLPGGPDATALAQRLGKTVDGALSWEGVGAYAEIDSVLKVQHNGRQYLRISGWLCDSGESPVPPLIGVGVDSVLSGWTQVEPEGKNRSRWTIFIPGSLRDESRISILCWRGKMQEPRLEGLHLRRTASQEAAAGEPAPIHGFVDEVVDGSEFVVFRGWARHAGNRCAADRVIVTANGLPVQTARPWGIRPDVAAVHGGSDVACGFQIEVPRQRIAGQTISIFGLTEAGSRSELAWGPGVRFSGELGPNSLAGP